MFVGKISAIDLGGCPPGARQTISDISMKDDSVEHIDHFDIMIVGAGPAGISTWLHLKKFAPELADHTLLIDKAVFPRGKLCAGGFGTWGEDVLNQLDIALDIPSLFVSDVEFRFRDQIWVFHSPNPFRMVQRADFDMVLVDSAIKRGMVFHENEQFIRVERVQDTLVVMTSQGKYRVKALVGADGSLSRVRRAMMRPYQTCLAPTIQVSAPVEPSYDTEFACKKMLIDFSSVEKNLQGYTWHFPVLHDGAPFMNHGIVNFRLFPDRPRGDMKKIFHRELQTRHIAIPPGAWSSHPIRWYSDDVPIAGPNVILAGDAAGIEPALGGGIHMALSYGEVAARELIQAFQNQNFLFRQYKKALMSNYLGQDIREFIDLAHKIYGGEENPLKQVREFLTNRLMRNKLRSLLLSQKNIS